MPTYAQKLSNVKALPHVTISSTMVFYVAKIASARIVDDIVDEIVMCGRDLLKRLYVVVQTNSTNVWARLQESGRGCRNQA